MSDPWEKAYVYGKAWRGSRIAHIVDSQCPWGGVRGICLEDIDELSPTPKPYPVCKNCLRTKRAKELGVV